jgi:cytochrome P450
MAGIFYFLLRHPQALARLETELLSGSLPSSSSKEPIPYTQAQKLPYLHAVIRETMRLHPAVGMPLERYVPTSGLSLPDGSFVPGGTAVGMNPFIVNRTAPFGEAPGAFRPERWLLGEGESEDDFKARLGAMNDADLSFGAGSRMCAGRHIANVEMYKVVATLVTRYCFELVEPEKEWTVSNGWFMRAKGVNVRVSRR